MGELMQQFVDAGILMLAGMAFVFVFLGLLVVFINQVLVRLSVAYPDPIVVPAKARKVTSANKSDKGVSPKVVAAISAAVSQHRQKHNKS
ncbi:OadG family transporter subunit [Thalassotalea ganghwensis]